MKRWQMGIICSCIFAATSSEPSLSQLGLAALWFIFALVAYFTEKP